MLDRYKTEKYRLKTEATRSKFQFTKEEKEKAFKILSEYLKEPEFIKGNMQGQQLLLAGAFGEMVANGIPDTKAVGFISNAHGRVSGTNGHSLSILNELLGVRK